MKLRFKVRLRWFGAVLQCSCKFVLFLLSINTLRRTIYHWIAKKRRLYHDMNYVNMSNEIRYALNENLEIVIFHIFL